MRFLLGFICFFIVSAFAADTPPVFMLNTNGFLDGGVTPLVYTCDGKDISPQLDWANIPDKTQTLALLHTDPKAPKGIFYHWVLYNIPKTVKSLEEGVKPTGFNVGKNSWGKTSYNGPCPPKGTVHTYYFTIYALDTKLNLPDNADGNQVTNAMKDHIIAKAQITMIYPRWPV